MKDSRMSEDRPQTVGEYRVGVSFNPSNNSAVDEIKRKTAELIDLMMALTRNRDAASAREAAIAATAYEDAAMWAVKAVTRQPRA